MWEKPEEKDWLRPTRAEDVIDLSKYAEIPEKAHALQLVSSVEHMAQMEGMEKPRVIEIGPVPTFHYELQGFGMGKYNPERGRKLAFESDTPPIVYLADRNPDWHFAAVGHHGIPAEDRTKLLGQHADLYMHDLGPSRKRGLSFEDVWDEEYMLGKGILERHYGTLAKKLSGAPDIIFVRHVFDYDAPYPAAKLTTVAAMLLRPGGLLISEVHGSGPRYSHVPLVGDLTNFPFDAQVNIEHIMTLEFGPKNAKFKDYVYVYRKKGDSIRPAYLKRSKEKKTKPSSE